MRLSLIAALLITLSLATVSCHQQKQVTKTTSAKIDTTATTISATTTSGVNMQPDKYIQQLKQGTDFIASGTEPFWSLEIDFDKTMYFKTVSGFDLTTSAVEGVKAMDATVTRYAAETEKGSLIVQIMKLECVNNMSGEKSAYSVKINAKNNTDTWPKIYEGCGQYLYDYRINDIWILESINNKKLASGDFTKGLPQLEINLAQNKVFGHTGCNNINGAIELQGKKIHFSYLASTRMACPTIEFENKYLNSLSNHTIPYFIEPGKLHLRVDTDSTFIFRKID